jgi:hypothetical protein
MGWPCMPRWLHNLGMREGVHALCMRGVVPLRLLFTVRRPAHGVGPSDLFGMASHASAAFVLTGLCKQVCSWDGLLSGVSHASKLACPSVSIVRWVVGMIHLQGRVQHGE